MRPRCGAVGATPPAEGGGLCRAARGRPSRPRSRRSPWPAAARPGRARAPRSSPYGDTPRGRGRTRAPHACRRLVAARERARGVGGRPVDEDRLVRRRQPGNRERTGSLPALRARLHPPGRMADSWSGRPPAACANHLGGNRGDERVAPPLEPQGLAGSAAPPSAARWFNVRLSAVEDERRGHAGMLVVLREVTERRQMVETIRVMSLTDGLTGLLNRRGFTTLAEQQLRTSIRTRNRLWLVFADLDGLKEINDRLGHEAGDRALSEVAELLRTGTFREADLVARFGGDEFAILATEISPTDGTTLARRIDDVVRRANETPDRAFALSLSAGVALFDPDLSLIHISEPTRPY